MATASRAEQLKQKGNECFQKGKYNAAIDMYTEAIVMDPTQSTYFSNRALCHSKLQHWASCREDCEQALRVDALNSKASYLLGMSLVHLDDLDAAVAALTAALASAEKTKKAKSLQQDITLELRRVTKQRWLRRQALRRERHDAMHTRLAGVIMAAASDAQQRADSARVREMDELLVYMEELMSREEASMAPKEMPEYFVCPISMEIMHDPVSTPNGVSYERRCIEEHLKKNGAIDPLTRKTLTLDMLRPNASLRAAIQDYLSHNPWAFEH
ncbi:hypothetical protein P43SY_005423 [Pythium insidiosum]|uniref:E3 ubiquitin-protein ligase CHIP n=1 Tax=Pythium insidiosum TaxID=114742 RepID=A0AAD5L776_PYTIN|nr:hypothetical protein P43SY_005423 [Pythium insidiosum]KAJ0392997.1 hypothetical protein ATCC90586_006400 [Pythium insidiosum]